jgi:hypothetical protein
VLMRPRHFEDVPHFDPEDITSLWVASYPSPQDDLRYAVTIVASTREEDPEKKVPDKGDVLLCTLRGYQPMRYAAAVLSAWARAQLEQAMWAQMQRMQMSLAVAAHVVMDWRKRQDPLNPAHTDPLMFSPIVSNRTFTGMVQVSLRGVPFGQWDLTDVLGHATNVLEGAALTPCEQAYFEALTGIGVEGVEPPDDEHWRVGHAAVSQLSEHMDIPATVDGWSTDGPASSPVNG